MTNKLDIEKLISKVKLNISDFDYDSLKNDISNIVGWIEKIEPINVENVETCSNILASLKFQNSIKDLIKTENVEDIMQNTTYKDSNYFTVPKVIKHS